MSCSTMRSVQVMLLASSIAFGAAASDADDWKTGKSAEEKVEMMDSDGSGSVSSTEHATRTERMFDQLDVDRDGKVTAAEMDATHQDDDASHERMSSADKIKTVDSDADGSLSAAEHASGSHAMFAMADTNGDGSLTIDEVKASHVAMVGKEK